MRTSSRERKGVVEGREEVGDVGLHFVCSAALGSASKPWVVANGPRASEDRKGLDPMHIAA